MRSEVMSQLPVKEIALQWFDNWKRDIDSYWRVRNIIGSRADRGDATAQGIEKVLQNIENNEFVPLQELLGAFWLLREIIAGNDIGAV